MKRFISICLSASLILAFCLGVFAQQTESDDKVAPAGAAENDSPAGSSPAFSPDRAPTRYEAITMLVCLLGKETEALHGTWEIPFTDVEAWALPYVGYAYANGLIPQTAETHFGGNEIMTNQAYMDFLLPALGYSSLDLAEKPTVEADRANDGTAAEGLAGILHAAYGVTPEKAGTALVKDTGRYTVDKKGTIPTETGERQLTDEQLKKLAGKKPAEAASAISTLADAYAWLSQEGYKTTGMNGGTRGISNEGYGTELSWVEMSTVLNTLLKDDYDEVGTLLVITQPAEAGWDFFHISFNYVKHHDMYYITDPIDHLNNTGRAIYRAHTIKATELSAVKDALEEINDTSDLLTLATYPLYTARRISVKFQKEPMSVAFPDIPGIRYLYRADEAALDAYAEEQAAAEKAEAERWAKKAETLKIADYRMPEAIGNTTLDYPAALALVGAEPKKIADAVKTVGDVLQYMIAARFGYNAPQAYTPWYDGWGFDAPGDEQLKQNYGCCCGGYANTVSYLLQGNYEKVGTLRWVGGGNHTISWVYTGGKYYVFDFTQYCNGGNYSNTRAPVTVLDSLTDFYQQMPNTYSRYLKDEIVIMVAFEAGEAMYPSTWQDPPRFTSLTFPTEAKGKVTLIYQRDPDKGVRYADIRGTIPGWEQEKSLP